MGVRKLHMRQAYRIIPIYTADVSGVCSALYELGGMTVMHDPSGCNSTYNTHDEIRWRILAVLLKKLSTKIHGEVLI